MPLTESKPPSTPSPRSTQSKQAAASRAACSCLTPGTNLQAVALNVYSSSAGQDTRSKQQQTRQQDTTRRAPQLNKMMDLQIITEHVLSCPKATSILQANTAPHSHWRRTISLLSRPQQTDFPAAPANLAILAIWGGTAIAEMQQQ